MPITLYPRTWRLCLLRRLLAGLLRLAAACVKRREIIPDADFMHLWNYAVKFHVALGGWDAPHYPDADSGKVPR